MFSDGDSDFRHFVPELEKKTGIKVGAIIAENNGAIFQIKNLPGKVVKVSHFINHKTRARFFKYLKKIKSLRAFPAVKVYQYGVLSDNHYFYVMDKLKPLNRNESILVDGDFDMYDLYLTKQSIKFCRAAQYYARKYKLRHWDTHSNNVMKDSKGNLKFVDLESFLYRGGFIS